MLLLYPPRSRPVPPAPSLPACSGLEVAGGSHRMADVVALFAKLAKRLAADREWSGTRPGGGMGPAARGADARAGGV